MKYYLFEKTTSAGLPALYCRVKNQPENSNKCLRLFVIAPHGLICVNPNIKYLKNCMNSGYFLEWLKHHETKPFNSCTTSHQTRLIEEMLKLFAK